jgi:c-di-GMP-binding flagellar brake protein YcgR
MLSELEEDSRYQIQSRAEVIAILRGILDKGALVTINFDQGKEFVLSSLLRINPEFEELVFDIGPDEACNHRLLQTERLTVVTEQDHIKIQFRGHGAEATTFEEQPAFRIRLPQTLMRLQRREYFRAAPPASRSIKTQLRTEVNGTNASIEAKVLDISCGGVALVADGQIPGVEVGKIYHMLVVQLPEIGTITFDIEIRSIAQFTGRASVLMTRLGCQFVSLPAAMMYMVQRYITKLEVSRKQRT